MADFFHLINGAILYLVAHFLQLIKTYGYPLLDFYFKKETGERLPHMCFSINTVKFSLYYCPFLAYAASTASFSFFHQSSCSSYHLIVSANPSRKFVNSGCQPSSSRNFVESIA